MEIDRRIVSELAELGFPIGKQRFEFCAARQQRELRAVEPPGGGRFSNFAVPEHLSELPSIAKMMTQTLIFISWVPRSLIATRIDGIRSFDDANCQAECRGTSSHIGSLERKDCGSVSTPITIGSAQMISRYLRVSKSVFDISCEIGPLRRSTHQFMIDPLWHIEILIDRGSFKFDFQRL
jgi:hypothetical protein